MQPTQPSAALARFRRWAQRSAVVVYLVILAGSIVRSTGAGMGCPDWPRCFGRLIPPTDVSQLPPDYRTRYATQLHGVDEFNAVKTWTEFLNRLLGAATGIVVLLTVVYAWPLRRSSPKLFYLSILALALVLFVAWLGKVVVDTNLRTGMVTVHMLVALLIACLLIYLAAWPRLAPWSVADAGLHSRLRVLSVAGMVLMGTQVALGTTVREGVDEMLATALPRDTISQNLAHHLVFVVHRSFSILVLLCAIALYWLARPLGSTHLLVRSTHTNLQLMAAVVLAGMALAYLDLPLWAQPVHLLGGALLIGMHFFILLVVYRGVAALPVKA